MEEGEGEEVAGRAMLLLLHFIGALLAPRPGGGGGRSTSDTALVVQSEGNLSEKCPTWCFTSHFQGRLLKKSQTNAHLARRFYDFLPPL